jgi:hypothetical protein
MELRKSLPPPNEPPKSNGCLIAVLIGLVLLLIGWGMCSGALGV